MSQGFARSRTLLFLVRAGAAGLVRARQTSLDATRPQARLELREVEAEAMRLLRDVHVLARQYGWREADIIAMSPLRRQMYVEMADA